jgi:ABC-2 type transport system ATP-binding protein
VDVAAARGVLSGLGVQDAAEATDGLAGSLSGVEPERIVRALVEAGVAVRGFAVVRPTLEEAFVELTGEGFDVSG